MTYMFGFFQYTVKMIIKRNNRQAHSAVTFANCILLTNPRILIGN